VTDLAVSGMSEATVLRLRAAVDDDAIVERYWSHVRIPSAAGCWLWTGAISGKGHGRFQIAAHYQATATGTRTRQTFVVIAHRFGYALEYGVDALLDVPIVSHRCDNPLCQNPRCWRESNHRANGQEYAQRRYEVRGSLADQRGARGRARAVRDAARRGDDVSAAMFAGWLPVHRDQQELFRVEREEPHDRRS